MTAEHSTMPAEVSPDANACAVWRFLDGSMRLRVGSIVIGPGGEAVRLLTDGGVEEVGTAVPNRRGVLVSLSSAGGSRPRSR